MALDRMLSLDPPVAPWDRGPARSRAESVSATRHVASGPAGSGFTSGTTGGLVSGSEPPGGRQQVSVLQAEGAVHAKRIAPADTPCATMPSPDLPQSLAPRMLSGPAEAARLRAVFQGYRHAVRVVQVGRRCVELLEVAELETLVDRDALLRGEAAPEPPYWAYLWTGARELAVHLETAVRCSGLRVLDLGCGLGLAGIVAALGGADVTFMDREIEALGFAAASADRNGCGRVAFCQADFACARLNHRFDLILAAEVLYDRKVFPRLIEFLTVHLAPAGAVLLADARRIDTRGFYDALRAAGYQLESSTIRAREEQLPLRVDLVRAQR